MTDRTGARLYARERDAAELPGNRATDRAEALRSLTAGRSVVYAIRLADGIIKIGCTESLWKRRRAWGSKAEILGFVFGEFEDEQRVHANLIAHRARGHEYYHPTREVLAVVNEMRDEWNLPHIAA